jgi:hypothetical protein
VIAYLFGLAIAGGVLSTPPPLPVTVTAPPECAGARSLDAEVTTCLSVVPSGAAVDVSLTPRGGGFTAQIELLQSGHSIGTRVIELPRGTCSDALRAVALAICIALDSAGSPWVPTVPHAREDEPAQPRPRAYRDAVFGPAVSWRAAAVDSSPPCAIDLRLQLGASIAIGLTPDTAIGMAAGASAQGPDWRIELAVTHLPPSRFEGPVYVAPATGSARTTSLDVSWTGASATGFWRRGPWLVGAWFLAGAHAARQRGFEGDADAPISPYVAMGGRVGFDVPVLEGAIPLALAVHVDVGGALLRGRYVVETGEGLSAVWVPPAVPVLIGLVLSAELF